MQNIYILHSKNDINLIPEIIAEIKNVFQKASLEIFIDEEQVKFKDSYEKYYEKIGNSKFVIMLITDNFLQDKNCMSIAYQLSKYKDFNNRVFPIVFPDAKIYDAVESIDYLQFWENKKFSLEEKIRTLTSFEHLNAIMQDINTMSNIRMIISQFINDISNMFSVSIDNIKQKNYNDLITVINQKMR